MKVFKKTKGDIWRQTCICPSQSKLSQNALLQHHGRWERILIIYLFQSVLKRIN